MENTSVEPDEELANALLPYMENPDESSLASLTGRLADYGIGVHTAVVPGASEFSITFTKQNSSSDTLQLADGTDHNWDFFAGLLATDGFPANMFENEPLPGATSDLVGGQDEVGAAVSAFEKTRAGSEVRPEAISQSGHGQNQGEVQDLDMSLDILATVGQSMAEENGEDWYALLGLGQESAAGQNTAGGRADGLDASTLLAGDSGPSAGGSGSSAGGVSSNSHDGENARAVRWTSHGGDGEARRSPARRRGRKTMSISRPSPSTTATAMSTTDVGVHVDALAMVEAQFGGATKHKLSRKVLEDILDLSRQLIRPDLIDFLEEALPRWQARGGLWSQEQLPGPLLSGTGQARLFTAYSCICKLDARMGDDQVRNRMAVVMLHSAYELACKEGPPQKRPCTPRTAKGRGDATAVIDDILARLHDDWDLSERKTQLRNRFHDKKRYGKRWLILTRALGDSLLFAASPRIASLVHNTVFTIDMLAALTYCVQHFNTGALRVLQVLNRSASRILHHGQTGNLDLDLDLDHIVAELRTLLLPHVSKISPSSAENSLQSALN